MSTNTSAAAGGRAALTIAGLIALVTVAVFARTGWHDALVYDDLEYVFENPRVLGGLSLGGLKWAFTSFHSGNWHPLTWVSHMLDVQLFGLRPGLHHLSNVALHTTTAVALFLVLRGATGALVRSALVAALFAVHPLHVQSVAWIAERKDVLSGLFWVLTLGAYARYCRAPSPRRMLAVAALFVLGLMSKPMLVTLPVILVLLDYWPLGRLRPCCWKRDLVRLCGEKAPLFLLSAGSAVVTIAAQRAGHSLSGLENLSAWARVANAAHSYLRYIGKTLLPGGLSVFYPHPGAGLPWWVGVASLIALALATAGALHATRRRGFLLVGWLWYLVALLPVIGIVQVGAQAMADRYSYLPLAGLFVLVVWQGQEIATRRHCAAAAGVAATFLLLALATLAFRETGHWRDSLSLFEHSSASVPRNSTLLTLEGTSLLRMGRVAEAVPVLREASALAPGEADVHYNLGSALARLGALEEAAAHYRASLAIQPADAGARVALGDLLFRMGAPRDALRELLAALALDPDNAVVHRELSRVHERLGDPGKALEHARRFASLAPRDAQAPLRVGLLLARTNRLDEAFAEFQRAVTLDPKRADALYNMGLIFDLKGDAALAVEQYRRALAADPSSALAHNSLGAALMDLGRRDEAIVHFGEALRLEPGLLDAQVNLMRAGSSR